MLDLPLLAAAASTTFMLMVVSSSAVCAVLIALNVTSLKHRSTNRACVYAAVVLLVGVVVGVAGLGLGTINGNARVLSGIPGRISAVMLFLSVVGALFGLFQLRSSTRQRRGRKRGVFTLLGAVAFGLVLLTVEYQARHPKVELPTSQTRELPLDPYRAVLGTPTAQPSGATNTRPEATPRRPAPGNSPD